MKKILVLILFSFIKLLNGQEKANQYFVDVDLGNKKIALSSLISVESKDFNTDCKEQILTFIRKQIETDNPADYRSLSFSKMNFKEQILGFLNDYEKLKENYKRKNYEIMPIDVTQFKCLKREKPEMAQALKWLQNSQKILKDIYFDNEGVWNSYLYKNKILWKDIKDIYIMKYKDDDYERIQILTDFYDEMGYDVVINLEIKDRDVRELFFYYLQNYFYYKKK